MFPPFKKIYHDPKKVLNIIGFQHLLGIFGTANVSLIS